MGTDIYVPSLPAISNAFHISTTLAQTSVAIYILGYGVGQLIVGPISDHYGRKPIVIIGFLLYISFDPCLLIFSYCQVFNGIAVLSGASSCCCNCAV